MQQKSPERTVPLFTSFIVPRLQQRANSATEAIRRKSNVVLMCQAGVAYTWATQKRQTHYYKSGPSVDARKLELDGKHKQVVMRACYLFCAEDLPRTQRGRTMRCRLSTRGTMQGGMFATYQNCPQGRTRSCSTEANRDFREINCASIATTGRPKMHCDHRIRLRFMRTWYTFRRGSLTCFNFDETNRILFKIGTAEPMDFETMTPT